MTTNSGDHNQGQNHAQEQVPQKKGFLGRVKDHLDVTKHLGFVSDLDSPANQAALAEIREKEEREGKTEVVPQEPLQERVKEQTRTVAQAVIGTSAVAAGGVAPRGETPHELAKAQMDDVDKIQSQGNKDGAPDPSTGDVSTAQNEDSRGSQSSKDSKHYKFWQGHKGQDSDKQQHNEDHSFGQWAARTAKKVGHAVASKDLSDDLLQKKTNGAAK